MKRSIAVAIVKLGHIGYRLEVVSSKSEFFLMRIHRKLFQQTLRRNISP